jgi:hypothetical protein
MWHPTASPFVRKSITQESEIHQLKLVQDLGNLPDIGEALPELRGAYLWVRRGKPYSTSRRRNE